MLASAPDLRPDSRPDWRVVGVREAIEQVLVLLTAKERKVVVERFGLRDEGQTRTLEQMGRAFGLTKERVRQIERTALRKLHTALAPKWQDLFD